MLRNILIFILMLSGMSEAYNQKNFSGEYKGVMNGDPVRMVLSQSGSALTGTMEDSQQKYQLEGLVSGSTMKGKATESSLGIVFDLDGNLEGDLLKLTLTLDFLGTKQEMKLDLTKSTKRTADSSSAGKSGPTANNRVKLPAGAHLDPDLVGMWTRSENYNSGYGDNFMGASIQESIRFYPDGSLSDGGSRAGISGSYYSGSSESSGTSEKIEGAGWYNIGNQLYIAVSQNGKTETAHLGKYYIENGAMLITAQNGNKTLLKKQ